MRPTRRFEDLDEREILALAITAEEEDGRIYLDMARRLKTSYPATAAALERMAAEETEHRRSLLDLFERRFGPDLPYITRRDVRGFPARRPIWLLDNLRVDAARRLAAQIEAEAATFYTKAASRARDVETRRLLGDLAEAERGHEATAAAAEDKYLSPDARRLEDIEARKSLVLKIVQPGLAGLIDGSVSTLAPVFAAAFATHDTWQTFLVGLAASVGAGISMGLTEAMSDDGVVTGRGSPLLRGTVCGVMTTLGGLGHALPYLITDFWTATVVAILVAAVELLAICWIRWRWMETPFGSAMVQILLGGSLVLGAGILIGSG